MERIGTSRETSLLTHLPRVGVIKWLSDEETDILQLPAIAQDANTLVHPGSVFNAIRVSSNIREDYVLLGFGYSEETARSNAKHFLEEQEKIFQIGLQQKVKDTPEDRSDDEVVISGKGSHHEVSYGPEWDETLPKV